MTGKSAEPRVREVANHFLGDNKRERKNLTVKVLFIVFYTLTCHFHTSKLFTFLIKIGTQHLGMQTKRTDVLRLKVTSRMDSLGCDFEHSEFVVFFFFATF